MAAPGEVTFAGVDCHNEREMLSIVIEEAPGSSCSMSSHEKWWDRMNNGIRDEMKKSRMIHMVPEVLRKKESCTSCFEPLVVSIGPYHYGKSELREMEKLKDSMALQFSDECKTKFSAIYSEVEKISGAAKGYYPQELVSLFDEKGFTRLMVVDGCFVLQFIDNFLFKRDVRPMTYNIAAFVRRDLMLLENQLPYIVLENLMKFRGNDGEKLIDEFIHSIRGVPQPPRWSCMRPTAEFYDKCCSKLKDPLSIIWKGKANQADQRKPAEEPNNKVPPLHLLDIFLRQYINVKYMWKKPYEERDHDLHSSYPAANELNVLGILFRPSAGKHFTDIRFISTPAAGLLLLPQIRIDDTTKSMLLNLVAYENGPNAPDALCALTSYICFMDSLIHEAEDVKVLRSNGIVINLLRSDQQAAELFHDIAQDLEPSPFPFHATMQRIGEHSMSRQRTWMAAFINTHFNSIAWTAAIATIVMTFVQTFFTVKGYYSGKGR